MIRLNTWKDTLPASGTTGELFEYLKLATWDEESPLGWKPTDRLLKIIGMKAASLSRPRPLREEHFYPFLLEILHHAASPTNHFIDLRSFTYSARREHSDPLTRIAAEAISRRQVFCCSFSPMPTTGAFTGESG